MSDFRIEEVREEDRFSNEHGEFVVYSVRFSGEQGSGTASHKRKSTSPAPSVGEVIDGELVQKNGKTELKRVWKQAGGGGSSSSGWKPRDPRETRQIVHQHAQKAALQYATVRAYQKTLPTDFTLQDIFKIAAEIRADVEAVE